MLKELYKFSLGFLYEATFWRPSVIVPSIFALLSKSSNVNQYHTPIAFRMKLLQIITQFSSLAGPSLPQKNVISLSRCCFQPIWPYGNLPQIEMKSKNVWNHHPLIFLSSLSAPMQTQQKPSPMTILPAKLTGPKGWAQLYSKKTHQISRGGFWGFFREDFLEDLPRMVSTKMVWSSKCRTTYLGIYNPQQLYMVKKIYYNLY